MVTIEISTIIYSGVGCLVAVVGFLLVRLLSDIRERIDKTDARACVLDKRVDAIKSDLDHLLGEHESIKEQCKKPRRRT